MLDRQARIFITGHTGMVGAAIVGRLRAGGYNGIVTATHAELDLTNQNDVAVFLEETTPDVVIHAAGKVGGIAANNTYRAEFLYDNLMMAANVIHASWKAGVQRLLYLGSSCIYPRECVQPMKEDYLLTGALEPTNEPYALAKIAGVKLCENYNRQYGTRYLAVLPTNLYGPGDHYDLATNHVLPALIAKAHAVKMSGGHELVLWGTGEPRREFLYVDDLADACLMLLEKDAGDMLYNIGYGEEITIRELAQMVMRVVGCNARIAYDASKPDGMARKLLDSNRIRALGWRPRVALEQGIAQAYADFLAKGAV